MTYIGNNISKVIFIVILVNFLVIVESAVASFKISFIFSVRKQTDSRLRSAVHCQDTKRKVNYFLKDMKKALLTIADDYIYDMTTLASTRNPIPWTWIMLHDHDPWSKIWPWLNRRQIPKKLINDGIKFVFLGSL